jgi:hypothetical protein
MTVLLTSTVIVLGTNTADSNACTGATPPIILSYRECRPFQPCRFDAIAMHSSRAPAARANKPPSNRGRRSSPARNRHRIFATIPIVPKLPQLRSIRLL